MKKAVRFKKPLAKLSKREHEVLKQSGMLYEIYPNATGNFYDDCDKREKRRRQ